MRARRHHTSMGFPRMSRAIAINGFALQERILREADSDEKVEECLASSGLTLDDLVYERSQILQWNGGVPPLIPEHQQCVPGVPLVSFFTGCGGMDLGFEAMGFQHTAAFEHSETFCSTLRLNRPNWRVFGPPSHSGDVSDFDTIANTLSEHIKVPFEGVFIGGPPCQPFSIAANQRFSKSGTNFKRVGFNHHKNGSLLFDYIRQVIEFRPAVFVIENVPGLRDVDGGSQLSAAINIVRKEGYEIVDGRIYDTSLHGIPQVRRRMIVVGSRVRGTYPKMPGMPQIGCGSVLTRTCTHGLLNHTTRNHKVQSVLRYMRLDYGRRDHLGRVDRLDPMRPSKTVIAGGTRGGGRSHLHPEIPRTLTVRECARLQTFPDDFEFVGSIARQFTQVGNAVPPVFASAIARQVGKAFFQGNSE